MKLGTKVLVTGADGFIGSHLAEKLVTQGCNVRSLVQYNSFNSWGWLDSSVRAPDMEIISGDVRDPYFCKKACEGIDVVFHLAALIAIPYSYVAPASYIDTNVTGTLNICQAALESGCSRILHTSTSEVYGTARYVPIDEKHPLQPQSPYSASKIGADAIAMSYLNSFNLPVTIVRPFNTYGPRQSARAVIPTVITQIAAGAEVIQLGDTTPTRDFNYVEDTCTGFLLLSECSDAIGQTVNIGSNYEISIGDTVDLIQQIMGRKIVVKTDTERLRPSGSEVFRLWADNTRIQTLTGFTPRFSIKEGLEKTIEWFSNSDNLAKYKTGVYNV